jgi:hypothetical protein
MISTKRPNVRGAELIRLLVRHEALSFGGLQTLMVPTITEKRLRDVLARLIKRRLVRRRLFNLFGGSAVFFEIAEPIRSDLHIASVHSSLLIHNESCSLAVERLGREFPFARFVREHAIPRDEVLRTVMKFKKGTYDTLPDVLMILPSETGPEPIYIAVEIERSIKSVKRLVKKFSKFALRTKLDGVIYLSEDEGVLTTLSDRYQTDIAPSGLRVKHYRDHFFLTASCPTKQVFELGNLRNSVNTPVSLKHWAQLLATTPMLKRREKAFLDSGGVRPD